MKQPITDPDQTEVLSRRCDVVDLLEQSNDDVARQMRDQVREVAARVFAITPEESGPVTPGQQLGPYRIVRLLGLGGQAHVYEALHERLGRRLALKIPRSDTKSRLIKEARLAVRLEHPHVLRIEDIGEHQGISYLVMEYCSGGNLDHLLERHPEGLPESEVRRITRALLEALDFIHTQGGIHRDVKPANVLFDAHGQVKLADFGLGTLSGGRDNHTPELSLTALTFSQGVIAGTPLYMAPEQENPALLVGQPLDGRADLFCLGKVIFQMLTGAIPRTIRPPSRFRAHLAPGWDELTFALLEEDRDRRTSSASEALRLLSEIGQPAAAEIGQPAAAEIGQPAEATSPPLLPTFKRWTSLLTFNRWTSRELWSKNCKDIQMTRMLAALRTPGGVLTAFAWACIVGALVTGPSSSFTCLLFALGSGWLFWRARGLREVAPRPRSTALATLSGLLLLSAVGSATIARGLQQQLALYTQATLSPLPNPLNQEILEPVGFFYQRMDAAAFSQPTTFALLAVAALLLHLVLPPLGRGGARSLYAAGTGLAWGSAFCPWVRPFPAILADISPAAGIAPLVMLGVGILGLITLSGALRDPSRNKLLITGGAIAFVGFIVALSSWSSSPIIYTATDGLLLAGFATACMLGGAAWQTYASSSRTGSAQ